MIYLITDIKILLYIYFWIIYRFFFRQTKGEQFKRGYFQKSFVLLTRRPYINLYSNIVQIIAPQFFESGKVAIEVAMHNFTCWEPIVPGKSYQVPLLGQASCSSYF